MKGIFGFISLLIVLAVVALVAKTQLHATANTSKNAAAAAASAAGLKGTDRTFGIAPEMGAATDPTLSDAQQIKQIQQQAAEGAVNAMQRGTERNERADQTGR